jgi:hypothetical protein
MSPTKLVGTVIGAIFTIWYTYSRILAIPEKKIRYALLPIIAFIGLWYGFEYGRSDQRFTYVDEEMSEVVRGYPFALERKARWYDGSSEDDVSPFPIGVRIMNFIYGLLVVHLFSTVIFFLIPVEQLTMEEIKRKIEELKQKKKGDDDDGTGLTGPAPPAPPTDESESGEAPKEPPTT